MEKLSWGSKFVLKYIFGLAYFNFLSIAMHLGIVSNGLQGSSCCELQQFGLFLSLYL